jgi:hypothetical protein
MVLTATSCASANLVRLEGPPASVGALAGEWTGTYSSPDVDREGTIWFTLRQGEDHAHGDVRMTPRGSARPYLREISPGDPREHLQFLGIRFVSVSETDVTGVLDRYWDPDAGSYANTEFRGRLSGDLIEGTFETRWSTGIVARGRWQAARKVAK